MNLYDYYIPIDVKGPIKTASKVNIMKHYNNTPVLLFQLFDGRKPLMLDDTSSVSIAFTNTDNVNTRGSGDLEILNPHRGTITYRLSNNDINMFGLHTVTLGIKTGESWQTVQTVIMCQELSDDLYNKLTNDNNTSNTMCNGNCTNCTSNKCCFPCKYYSQWCRSCRRCMFAWFHNTLPKPVSFEDIKVCKNPFIYPPIPNYENLSEYEKAYIPMTINKDGYVDVVIDDITYTCDIGKNGSLYLLDKSQPTPDALYGLYLGYKNTLYYKISEKINNEDFTIDSLFE